MNLKLVRNFPTTECVIGELFINDQFECYTLEDVERPVKLAGITAIPRGNYEVVITFSERFQKPLPLLLDVPNYAGVRIHPGNNAANTDGCILPGKGKAINEVTERQDAFADLFQKLDAASKVEKIFLEITG